MPPSAFAYSGGFITEAKIVQGTTTVWKWTCVISSDPVAQTTDFLITSPVTGKRTIKLTQDYIILSGQLLDQPESIVRGIVNGNGENVKSLFFDPNNEDAYLLWEGTSNDFLSRIEIGKHQAYMTTFTVGNPNDGYSAFTFTQEATYPQNVFDQGTPDAQIAMGAPQTTYDAAGYQITWEYDSQYFPTKATYGDSTYETWQYNTNHQVTRYRDRLGRVTKMVYDSSNNLIEKHVGILEVAGMDMNQPEYGVYKYEFNSLGQVTKEMDPLYNPASPDLHVTEYSL